MGKEEEENLIGLIGRDTFRLDSLPMFDRVNRRNGI